MSGYWQSGPGSLPSVLLRGRECVRLQRDSQPHQRQPSSQAHSPPKPQLLCLREPQPVPSQGSGAFPGEPGVALSFPLLCSPRVQGPAPPQRAISRALSKKADSNSTAEQMQRDWKVPKTSEEDGRESGESYEIHIQPPLITARALITPGGLRSAVFNVVSFTASSRPWRSEALDWEWRRMGPLHAWSPPNGKPQGQLLSASVSPLFFTCAG